jgi:hypothetical protein
LNSSITVAPQPAPGRPDPGFEAWLQLVIRHSRQVLRHCSHNSGPRGFVKSGIEFLQDTGWSDKKELPELILADC